ncbi:hypothetical protein ACIBQX_18610 [Nonomuraea sp. NPDC049714]|uniref:hypothetical protein n=1 Tax=Nonomuraea sp. NPDC049714 TaxID=3364357 RepID=UPI0037AD156E
MTTTPTSADQARDLLDKAADGNCRRATNAYDWDSAAAAQRDAQAGIGNALLAIHEDLTGLRGDLADIAAAVRELAAVQRRPRRRWPLARTREQFDAGYDRAFPNGDVQR